MGVYLCEYGNEYTKVNKYCCLATGPLVYIYVYIYICMCHDYGKTRGLINMKFYTHVQRSIINKVTEPFFRFFFIFVILKPLITLFSLPRLSSALPHYHGAMATVTIVTSQWTNHKPSHPHCCTGGRAGGSQKRKYSLRLPSDFTYIFHRRQHKSYTKIFFRTCAFKWNDKK